MSHHHPKQLEAWMNRCRSNLAKFRQNRHALTEEEQLEFVRNQYFILQMAVKVVKGHARFEGV